MFLCCWWFLSLSFFVFFWMCEPLIFILSCSKCLKNTLKCPTVDPVRDWSKLWKLHPKSHTTTHRLQLLFIRIMLGKKKDLNDHWYKWYKGHQQHGSGLLMMLPVHYLCALNKDSSKIKNPVISWLQSSESHWTRWSVFVIIKPSEIQATISNRSPQTCRSTSHKIFPTVMTPLGPM